MNAPRVSVIIPTFNSARFVRAALASVFAQTFTSYEVIVVDDASTDETCEVLESYGARIRFMRRSKNSGTADIPRYEAIESAQGQYCAMLDADDLWLPYKLERQVAFMSANPDIPLCHGYVMVMDEDGRDLYIRHENAIPSTGMIGRDLLRHCFISTSAVMVRREAWLTAQHREDITGYGTEWDFFLAIAREHPIGFLPNVLAKYRRHAGGISRKNWKRAPRDVMAMERINRKGLWRGIVEKREFYRIVAEACAENSQYWRDNGLNWRAVLFALKGLAYEPADRGLWRHLAASLGRAAVG